MSVRGVLLKSKYFKMSENGLKESICIFKKKIDIKTILNYLMGALDRNQKGKNWFRFPLKGKGILAERKILAENFGFLCSLGGGVG